MIPRWSGREDHIAHLVLDHVGREPSHEVIVVAREHVEEAVFLVGLVRHVCAVLIGHRQDRGLGARPLVRRHESADDAVVLVEVREVGDQGLGHPHASTALVVETDLVDGIPRAVGEVVDICRSGRMRRGGDRRCGPAGRCQSCCRGEDRRHREREGGERAEDAGVGHSSRLPSACRGAARRLGKLGGTSKEPRT